MADKENEQQKNIFNHQTIFEKYKISSQIGKGSFGTVYSGVNIITKEQIAVKTEIRSSKNQNCLLESEAYKLVTLRGFKGIPKVFQFGKIKCYNLLVM